LTPKKKVHFEKKYAEQILCESEARPTKRKTPQKQGFQRIAPEKFGHSLFFSESKTVSNSRLLTQIDPRKKSAFRKIPKNLAIHFFFQSQFPLVTVGY
jgi:hypothetical protein